MYMNWVGANNSSTLIFEGGFIMANSNSYAETNQFTQARIPVFPRSVKGRFRTIKTTILVLAYSVYFLLPWLPWSRTQGPNQAILFDIVSRKFYIFDLVVYAQDIFWLAGFLIIAAFLLFFVTGVAGRIFCGYFCFQTLWTDVFIFLERLVQGERNQRIKLANSPWNLNKLSRYSLTWLLWLIVGFSTGLSFTLYWGESSQLVQSFFSGTAPFPAYATTVFLTVATFVMAGMAREQVCSYMCPYARFQSAMFDKDTLIIGYDEQRGERSCGKCKPTKENSARQYRLDNNIGDCIDCGYCVQVCPVGIDIRNGLQYQCISCALCIDACNTVMDVLNYPRGLIKYTSENIIENSNHKTRWFKWKNAGYAVALLVVSSMLVVSITNRAVVEMHIEQIRQPLYVVLSDGRVQNRYSVKVINKSSHEQNYKLALAGFDNAALDVRPASEFAVGPGKSVTIQARIVSANIPDVKQVDFRFLLAASGRDDESLVERSSFLFPN